MERASESKLSGTAIPSGVCQVWSPGALFSILVFSGISLNGIRCIASVLDIWISCLVLWEQVNRSQVVKNSLIKQFPEPKPYFYSWMKIKQHKYNL